MRLASVAATIAVGWLVGCVGCAALRTPQTQIDFAGDRYASLAIIYRLTPASAADGGQSATSPPPTLSSSLSAVRSGRGIQTLAIKYPHPAGRIGYARVELVTEREAAGDAPVQEPKAGWLAALRRTARDELPGVSFGDNVVAAWGLDLPVAELDSTVQRLQSEGFFDDTGRTLQGAVLGAWINGVGAEKQWSRVPEIDALTKRVRARGRVVSHQGPTVQSLVRAAARSHSAGFAAALPGNLTPTAVPERLPPAPAVR